MPNELFGTPGGFRAYEEDQNQLNALALKAAMLPGEQALTRAQTRHQSTLADMNVAQTKALDAKAAREEAVAKMMAAANGEAGTSEAPGIDDLLSKFRLVTSINLAAGDIEGAKHALDAATTGAQRMAAADASKASEELRHVRAAKARFDFVQDRLSAVTDAASYAQARMAILSSPIMQGEDVSDLPSAYNPAIVRAIVANSKAANDKLELGLRQAAEARLERDSKVRNTIAEANKALNERRTAAYESRIEALNKAGGGTGKAEKPVGVASLGELKDTQAELKALGYNAADKTEFEYQAREIANEAKLLQKRNPALSLQEARAKVTKDALERGDLKLDTGFLGGNKNTFKPSEGTYAKPLALPATQEGLVPGRYYRMGDGSVKKYELPKAGAAGLAPRPPANNPLADDEED